MTKSYTRGILQSSAKVNGWTYQPAETNDREVYMEHGRWFAVVTFDAVGRIKDVDTDSGSMYGVNKRLGLLRFMRNFGSQGHALHVYCLDCDYAEVHGFFEDTGDARWRQAQRAANAAQAQHADSPGRHRAGVESMPLWRAYARGMRVVAIH